MRKEINSKGTTILYADENMIFTNGQTYGEIIYLSKLDNEQNWKEIPIEEYYNIEEE